MFSTFYTVQSCRWLEYDHPIPAIYSQWFFVWSTVENYWYIQRLVWKAIQTQTLANIRSQVYLPLQSNLYSILYVLKGNLLCSILVGLNQYRRHLTYKFRKIANLPNSPYTISFGARLPTPKMFSRQIDTLCLLRHFSPDPKFQHHTGQLVVPEHKIF